MPTLIHDATLLTPLPGRDGPNGPVHTLHHHSLLFGSGRVVALTPAADLAGEATQPGVTVVPGDRYIVTPGLINTHHHLYQSLTRCMPAVQNEPLFGWLRGLYAHWRRVTHEGVKLAAKVSLIELLRHGCTTTSDHFYLFPPGSDVRLEAVLEAADELGIRIHACRGSMSFGRSAGGLPPDDLIEPETAILADCQRVLDAWHDAAPYAMRRIDLAPCSPFNVSPELLRDTRTLARERGVLLHTHAAETRDEERYCLQRYGRRPLAYLADQDWLGPDVYLAHCVHLTADEIALLAHTRTGVSLCPTSNLRLGSGLPSFRALLDAGLRIGLGVDGASSNDGGNPLANAKTALLAARLQAAARDEAEALLPAEAIFRLLTAGGAACLNRPELGHLEPGAAADVALFRGDDPALAGAAVHDPLAALILCDVPVAERVFVAGREVVREGRVVGVDELALGEALNTAAARLEA